MEEEKKEDKKPETPVQTTAPAQPVSSGPQYRYQDEACSNIAFYAESKIGPTPSVCQNCGAPITRVLEERFIPLTEDEKASLKALAN